MARYNSASKDFKSGRKDRDIVKQVFLNLTYDFELTRKIQVSVWHLQAHGNFQEARECLEATEKRYT